MQHTHTRSGPAFLLLAFLLTGCPDGIDSAFTALPIQIFAWTQDPNQEFVARAAGAICVLMIILLAMNSVAIWLRNRYEQKW